MTVVLRELRAARSDRQQIILKQRKRRTHL
jgi:hypothetical protein